MDRNKKVGMSLRKGSELIVSTRKKKNNIPRKKTLPTIYYTSSLPTNYRRRKEVLARRPTKLSQLINDTLNSLAENRLGFPEGLS